MYNVIFTHGQYLFKTCIFPANDYILSKLVYIVRAIMYNIFDLSSD